MDFLSLGRCTSTKRGLWEPGNLGFIGGWSEVQVIPGLVVGV